MTDHAQLSREEFLLRCKATYRTCWFDVLGAALVGAAMACVIVLNLP